MENLNFESTFHAQIRTQQRGISKRDLALVMKHAKPIYKQGYLFYSLKNGYSVFLSKHDKSRLINLIIVSKKDEYQEVVITAYKSEKGYKKVRRKAKRLSKYTC